MTEVSTAADKVREWTERRNAALRSARAEGTPLRTLAEQAGMSVEGVRRITG